jgi:hypothetical protein
MPTTSLSPQDAPDSTLLGLTGWPRIVFLFGIPSAIALYLVWFLTANVAVGVGEMRDMLKKHEAEDAASRAETLDHYRTTASDNERIRVLLRQICVNTATSEAQKAECFR